MSIIPTIVRMSIIMALAIFGNFFLIFIIQRGNAVSKQRISPVQLLLLHTCFADLLFALVSIGSEIIILSTMPIFHAPDIVCRLIRYLQVLPLYASPFLLVAISIDRYQAICRPLIHWKYRSDRYKRPNCLALTAWVFAILCSIPQLLIWHKEPLELDKSNQTKKEAMLREECHSIYGDDPDLRKQAYVLWFSIIAWLLPSLIAAIFYYKVCNTVWKSQFWGNSTDNFHTSAGTITRKESSSIGRCQITRDYVEELRKSSTAFRNQMSEFDRKRVQTVRLTLTIVICNFFLWLPFCAINVIQAFAYEWALGSGRMIITQIATLGNLNSCVNPWIYILFNTKITKRALCSLITKRMESPLTSATRQTSLALTRLNNDNTTNSQRKVINNNNN